MHRVICLVAMITLAKPGGERVPVRADLDGDGVAETVSATAQGGQVRLEVRDARGRPLAENRAPAPSGRAARVALEIGNLGSAGALVEVVSSDGRLECRSVWRYRQRSIARIPVIARAGRAVADCEDAGAWTHRWDSPGSYVRERRRSTEDGMHHQLDVFRFSGFSMQLDASRSRAEIAGVSIPEWTQAVFYPRTVLQALFVRFDVAPVRSAPKFRLEADRDEGVFAFRWLELERDRRALVTASAAGKENEPLLSLRLGEKSGEARVELARGGAVPIEIRVSGLGEPYDRAYAPVTRFREGRLHVYGAAEDEIISEHLQGRWIDERGREIVISAIPGERFLVRFGEEAAFASLDRAPEGTDLLLLPSDGSAPRRVLDLRGANVLAVLPVRCESASGGCVVAGPAEVLRRAGARLNAGHRDRGRPAPATASALTTGGRVSTLEDDR